MFYGDIAMWCQVDEAWEKLADITLVDFSVQEAMDELRKVVNTFSRHAVRQIQFSCFADRRETEFYTRLLDEVGHSPVLNKATKLYVDHRNNVAQLRATVHAFPRLTSLKLGWATFYDMETLVNCEELRSIAKLKVNVRCFHLHFPALTDGVSSHEAVLDFLTDTSKLPVGAKRRVTIEDVEYLHHITDSSVNAVSILLNCLLLYLVKYHSTYRVRTYQVLLTIDATLDLLLGVVVLVGQPIFVNGEGFFVFMSNGFFSGQSVWFDSIMLMLYTGFMHINTTWIAAQFVFRFVFLCCRDNIDHAKRIAYVIFAIAVVGNVIAVVEIMYMFHPRTTSPFQAKGLHILSLNGIVSIRRTPIVFGAHMQQLRLQTWIAMWTFTCVSVMVVVIFCEYRIVKNFRLTGKNHDNTKQMHKEFHRALLAMAIVPLVTTTVPILYFMGTSFFEVTTGSYAVFLGIAVSSITLFNPLTTICFMRCYREAALKAIPCILKRATVSTTDTRITGLEVSSNALQGTATA
ncbi:Protein STR-90 [Aphelenchoides avenae]|nr:Protein STR-90 [Aphelenchus avenae]